MQIIDGYCNEPNIFADISENIIQPFGEPETVFFRPENGWVMNLSAIMRSRSKMVYFPHRGAVV